MLVRSTYFELQRVCISFKAKLTAEYGFAVVDRDATSTLLSEVGI
jgi:hypothetical protein